MAPYSAVMVFHVVKSQADASIGTCKDAMVQRFGHFGSTLALLWPYFGYMRVTLGHFRITLGSLWAYDAYVCGPDGPESENVLPTRAGSKIQGSPRTPTERTPEQSKAVVGGRGRGNPPPRSLFWRVLQAGRICCLVIGSARLKAGGLGGFSWVMY